MSSRGALDELLQEVRSCTVCAEALPHAPRPVLSVDPRARLLVVGQAPGRRVHESGVPWNDPSGDRLRDWMGISREEFYDARRVAIVPMGFCYPGTVKGGDLPPRPECAELWHERLLAHLPRVELTLLLSQYALKRYLGSERRRTVTETVRAWREYLPRRLPLPHPSWRNNAWLRRNPWFEAEVVPALRRRVRELLDS